MKIKVNGEEREFSAGLTLTALIVELGSKPDRLAIELNRKIVPRREWAETRLHEGDELEIVHFVGGGNLRA